jgi:predicted metalloprotease
MRMAVPAGSFGRLICAAITAVALTLSACGGGESTSESTSTTTAAQPPELPPIENDLGPRGYRNLLLGTFRLLDEFWGNQLPDVGAEPTPPKRLISYWSGGEDPRCEGTAVGPNNAQFCGPDNTIAWDGRWMLGSFYDRVGDAAVMFVLAHEYGHLVQDRIGILEKFDVTIEKELQADCLAGAWFGAVNAKVARLNRADYAALYNAIFDVADPRGLPWQNPQAHGTAKQRDFAFNLGARKGFRTCLRALRPGWTRR